MTSGLVIPDARDGWRWRSRARVAKFWADEDPTRARPYEVIEAENLLLTAGANLALNLIFGSSGTKIDATNGRVCVGDGTAATTAGQTGLQGANQYRQAFDSAPVISGNTVQFVSTIAAGAATFTWNEVGLANASSGGVVFNRFLQSFGAKGSSTQWVLTVLGVMV